MATTKINCGDNEGVVVTPTTTTISVCIVGAGFSGLSVAYHLTQHNLGQQQRRGSNIGSSSARNPHLLFDVHIVEARDRIGGRVYPMRLRKNCARRNQEDEDSVVVDMGGQWIHEASKRNPLVQLLKELQIPLLYAEKRKEQAKQKLQQRNQNVVFHKNNKSSKTKPPKVKNGTYLEDGTRIPDDIFRAASLFYNATLDKYNEDEVDVHTSFRDLLDQASRTNSQIQQQLQSPSFQCALDMLAHRTACYEGGRIEELSVSMDSLYRSWRGPDEIPVGGYHAVLQRLVDVIGRDRIRFQSPVTCIDHGSPIGVTVHWDLKEHDQEDESAHGCHFRPQQLTADYCVCTVPLGVMQHRGIAFQPPLAKDLWQSIDAMGMGVLDKVVLLFETQFWGADWSGGISPTSDPTRIQAFEDVTTDFGGHPALVMLSGGDAARRFDCPADQNPLTDEQVVAEAMATLRCLFGKSKTTLVPDPVSFCVSRWLQDPYAYGAYSFTKVGSTEQDYDRVSQPCGERLMFAGEHTSKHHFATVHGAWESGKREADRIIQMATTCCATT